MYRLKEIFYSLQGEGARAGRPAVFCRFAGCNLACGFCDTDYDGGIETGVEEVVSGLLSHWPDPAVRPYIVFTGGEPLMQLDGEITGRLKARGCELAVETNGTLPLPEGLDWVCVSPKAGAELAITSGNELKVVYPQEGLNPLQYSGMDFQYFFIQPMDGPELAENTRRAVEFCLENPNWRLGLQMHKLLGIR